MRMSAGRIRAINRAIARTHASVFVSRDGNTHRFPDTQVSSSFSFPPDTIKVVAVAK